jgi:hypothetical protein
MHSAYPIPTFSNLSAVKYEVQVRQAARMCDSKYTHNAHLEYICNKVAIVNVNRQTCIYNILVSVAVIVELTRIGAGCAAFMSRANEMLTWYRRRQGRFGMSELPCWLLLLWANVTHVNILMLTWMRCEKRRRRERRGNGGRSGRITFSNVIGTRK